MQQFLRTRIVPSLAAVALALAAGVATAKDDDDKKGVVATRLSGFNEVHFVAGPPAALRGAISTKASGSFKAVIDEAAKTINYELNYKDLESDVRQSHIHFGQRGTVGGIVVWLCQTAANPAPAAASGTPICPQDTSAGPVTGVITPGVVLAQDAQGFGAGEFDELVRAIRAGATYVNVHTATFGPGEIRGQLRHHH